MSDQERSASAVTSASTLLPTADVIPLPIANRKRAEPGKFTKILLEMGTDCSVSEIDLLQGEISTRIVAELERGAAPWIKPWSATAGANTPCNAATNRPYSGCNVVLLWMAAHAGSPHRRRGEARTLR